MAGVDLDLGSQHHFAIQSDLETMSASKALEHKVPADHISSNLSTQKRAIQLDIPTVSPLSHVRMSDSATTVTVARRQLLDGESRPYSDYSPYSSSPSTAVSSRAPSPAKEINAECEYKFSRQDRLKWRLASGFFAVFLGGWADGVTGTVIPYLSKDFNLTSTMSSSLFAGSTVGFFLGTFLVESIITILARFQLPRLKIFFFKKNNRNEDDLRGYTHSSSSQGRHLVLLIASIAHAMYFVMMGSRSGFPVMFLAYVVSALARALLAAPLYVYFAEGPKQALGYGLGSASLGSVISPLVCQSIISTGVPWYRFYYGSLLLSVFNIVFLYITFKPTFGERDREHQKAQNSRRSCFSSPTSEYPQPEAAALESKNNLYLDTKSHSTLRPALAMPYQWALSCFGLLYSGSETLTQGFMVTFLLSTRHADPKTIGYVTSGFWGGITVGRYIWGCCIPYLNFTQRKYAAQGCMYWSVIGERHPYFLIIILKKIPVIAVVMQLLILFLKSATQDAIYTGFIGLFYGPVFPAALGMANDILPGEVHMVAMALISSFASLGGAIFPLMAGAIFDAQGISKFTYVSVPVAAVMALVWALFPSRIPTRKVNHF